MDELRVGATPREVVPGDVEGILRLGRRLGDIAVGCEEAANRLHGLKASDWQGEAAEAFADALDQEPGKYVRAAEAFRDAAFAVRERMQDESDMAARRLSDAAEAAPNKPGWGSRLLHGAGEFLGGVTDATWGTGRFLWNVSQVRMVTDPEGWFHDVKGIGEGFVWGIGHPVEFGKAIADWDTWKENPARAAGRLVPDIALLLATAGAGAAGRGVRATEKAADSGWKGLRLRRRHHRSGHHGSSDRRGSGGARNPRWR